MAALRIGGAFAAIGPAVGLVLTMAESVSRNQPSLDVQMLNPVIWLLLVWGAYVVGGPPAFIAGALVGFVVRSLRGRRWLAASIAAAASSTATLGWLYCITGAVTREHVATAGIAAVAGVACCWIVPQARGFQADALGLKSPT